MNSLLQGFQEHLILNEEEVQTWLKRLETQERIHLIKEEDKIIGCISYELWDYNAVIPSLEIIMSWPHDITKTHLLEEGIKELLLQFPHVKMLNTMINHHRIDLIELVTKFHLKPWYEYMAMLDYQANQATSPHQLQVRNIEADDFERYFKVMGECFTSMRESVDIQPHNVVEKLWATDESKKKSYDEWMSNVTHTWMYFDQEEWVGSGLIVNGTDIDDVFVVPQLQGKGYGKAIILDLIQKIEANGLKPTIGYVKINERAKNLYLSCGFKITHHFDHMRSL